MMYDFLCLLPHAHASYSLIHYLNLHKHMHVAPYASISRSLDDIMAYERNFRPCIDCIGISTKDYHDPEIVSQVLGATRRDLIIQVVRDPIECFVSQVNNAAFIKRIRTLLNLEADPPMTMEEFIGDAVTRYITPYEAYRTYKADTFKRQVIIDVEDLKAGKIDGTLNRLWDLICGDSRDESLSSRNYHTSIGSKRVVNLRAYGGFYYREENLEIRIQPYAEGDLWRGDYNAIHNRYNGREVCLHHYPDINQYLPSLGLQGALHMCTDPFHWHQVHPKLRESIIGKCKPLFEDRMRTFDQIYKAADSGRLFTLDDLSSVQKEILKASIAHDVNGFGSLYPEVVEKWSVTNAFLAA